MKASIIMYAIPFFVLLMLVEFLVSMRQGKKYYRWNDTLADLNNGMGQQVLAIFPSIAFLWCYGRIAEKTLWHIPASSLMTWVSLFFIIDFIYYFFHRASHRVNFLWAAHVVHHQSEEYNLSVALRQSWFQGYFSFPLYLLLAVLGFPLVPVVTSMGISTVLQFWIHTRTINKLGVLEHVLNTPSHHRVHHGRNPKYLDRNYGAALIIWDKIFGTFLQEEDEPIYGIVKPLETWNVLTANTHYWRDLFLELKRQKTLYKKLCIFIDPPEKTFGAPLQIGEMNLQKHDSNPERKWVNFYLAAQLVTCIALLGFYLKKQAEHQIYVLPLLAVVIMLSLVSAGRLAENKRWPIFLEPLKWTTLILFFIYY